MNRRLIIGEDSVYEIDEDCMRKKDRSGMHCENSCADRKESGRKESGRKDSSRKDSGGRVDGREERDGKGRTGNGR